MIRFFKNVVPINIAGLVLSDLFISFAVYLAAVFIYLVPQIEPERDLAIEYAFWRVLPVTAVVVLGIYFSDLYSRLRVGHRTKLLQQLCIIIGTAFVSQAIVAYANRDWTVPKWAMIGGSIAALFLLFAWRIAVSAIIARSSSSQGILFLGRSPLISQVVSELAGRPEIGLRPIGYLDESVIDSQDSSLPRLGNLSDLQRIVRDRRPSQIVVGMSERRHRTPAQDLLELRFSGIRILEIATLYETVFGRVCASESRPSQLIFSDHLGPRGAALHFQSLYSRLLALTGLILAAPIIVATAILVRLTSPGPVLFRQVRVGLNGKPFTMFKFRSMHHRAEATTGPVWATRNDPRITPLGIWLRRLRLDELPQLFNVVRGDMAIVGPRPERPEFVQMLSTRIPYYPQRHCVMPGVTGWAQINYKYGETIEDTIMKLEYDLYYIKNASAWLDFYIMFHTIKIMLLSRGAQ